MFIQVLSVGLVCMLWISHSLENPHTICDINSDEYVDKNEFESCAKFPSVVGNKKKDAVIEIFRLFDFNSDNLLSEYELKKFIEAAEKDEQEVEVVTKDGKRKFMKQSEFLKMAEKRTEGISMDGGQMKKTEEGSASIEKIMKENPSLARFIGLGRWAHNRIQHMKYATGKLLNVRSLDDIAHPSGGHEEFETRVEILMKASDTDDTEVKFEAIILREPSVYGHGLRMTQLYMLSSDGSRLKELPPPLSKWRRYGGYLCGVVFIILYFLVPFFILYGYPNI